MIAPTDRLFETLRRLIVPAAVALLAAGCATGDFGSYGMSGERRAELLAENGQYVDAAGEYIGLAAAATGTERDRLTLLAIEQWLYAGDGQRARNALSQIETPASGELLWLWSTDAAGLSLWEGRPDRALALLDPLSSQPLPAEYRVRVDALRADAWLQKSEPLRAVDLYIQREAWLDSPRAVELGRDRLWAGLQVVDTQALGDAATVAFDPVARGWLTLAALASSTGQQGIGWSNGVIRWQESYPGHPAMSVLDDLPPPEQGVLAYPRQLALLLPLSGNSAAAGNAIKNGFLGAYFAATTGVEQEIRLYDVNAEGASDAYARAVRDGAEFVIGPLLRRNVAELASELLMPVPVLSLNYLPDNLPAPPGFFQFALSPEDEAMAAAQRAIGDEGLRGVALVPANDWGRRMIATFATEFEGLGGNLLEYQSYEPSAQDFAFEIEGLMGLTSSIQRFQRLRANIGGPIQFEPRRRQDVDFVFLAADAKAGRLIKSQLKFHYSGELPVYSTSFIYSMDGRSDADLDDVMFADAPWVVAPPAWIAEYPGMFREFWPSERRLARLHAMGYDAYQLVGELFNARENGIDEILGATGHLFLTEDGRIHRRLAWAQFAGGVPVPLPEQASPADLLDDGLGDPLDDGPDNDMTPIDTDAFEWPEPSLDD